MNDIMKIAKSLEESVFLLKCVNETIKIEAKEQKGRFLGMFFGIFCTILLGNLLTGKDTITVVEEFPVPPDPLTNFEVQAYYPN